MANPDHVTLAKTGPRSVELFRAEFPEFRFDLSGAQLMREDFSDVDLSHADLTGADLTGSTMIRTDLEGADLQDADLSLANLYGANLAGADLTFARLQGTDLPSADLSHSGLSLSNLQGVDMSNANLTSSDLSDCVLAGADLSGADLTGASLSNTILADCLLRDTKGLQLVVHEGTSSIGVDTLMRSIRAMGNELTPDLEAFALHCGFPHAILTQLPQFVAGARFYTCFISYGEPDVALAERLVNDLTTRGVSCWWYARDKTPGERTYREIQQRRREAQRVVVLCSARALVRDGLLKEIESQIDEDPDKIIPLSLDDLWRQDGFRVVRGSNDLKPALLERNYVSISDSLYDKSLDELLLALQRERVTN